MKLFSFLRERARRSIYVLLLALILALSYQLALSCPYARQGSSVEVFIFNSDGFSVLIVHGHHVKDIRAIIGGGVATTTPYYFPIVEEQQDYVRGRLVVYHFNLKGEKCLTVEAEPLDGGGDIVKEIPIIYLKLSVTPRINRNGTITIQGSVYAENYTISSSVIVIILPTGEIFSTFANQFGYFSIVVPYVSSYTVKAHGGYIVNSSNSAIICSTIEIVKVIS